MATKIADVMVRPSRPDTVIKWESLSRASRTCLDRLFASSGIRYEIVRDCIPFEVFEVLTVQELMDARNVGNKKAVDLILEMSMLFQSSTYRVADFAEKESIDTSDASVTHSDRYLEAIRRMALEASSISHLQSVLEVFYLDYKKVDQRSFEMWKLRSSVFCEVPLTLNEIGIQFGITREGVRQIVKRIAGMRIEGLPRLPLLSELTNVYASCNNANEFIEKTVYLPETDFSPFSAVRLRATCELFNQFELTGRLDFKRETIYSRDAKLTQLEIEPDEDVEHQVSHSQKRILDFERNKMGICDLGYLASRHNISKEDVTRQVLQKYPRSVFSKNLALARTLEKDSMFESALIKQLRVNSPISPNELVDGLYRVASTRSTSLEGMKTDLVELTVLLCGNEPNYETLRQNIHRDAELREVERWLVNELTESRFGFAHQHELLKQGFSKGMNLGTLSMYLVSGPIVREITKKIFTLVGSEVDLELAKEYSKQVEINASDTQFDVGFSEMNLVLNVTPSIATISNGSFFPGKEVSSQLADLNYGLGCFCEESFSEKMVSVSSVGAIKGLFDLFDHARSMHNFKHGDMLQIEFDPLTARCTLLGP